MTDYKCKYCGTLWKNAKPVRKHQLWNETQTHALYAGRATCTCGVGEDGLTAQ